MVASVSVIIVNWNGLDYLRECLPAVFAQDYPCFEVVIVDNGSSDGSIDWIQAHCPEVHLIRNSTNVGFALANNQGARETVSDYVVTLNNDTVPEPGWLQELVGGVETNVDVGMVASQIYFYDQPNILDSAGIEVDVLGTAWNRRLGKWVADEPEEYEEVFGPSAAAALYQRKMLEEIGFFDERYFAYYEDVELAWRARRAGWRCLYAPQARVAHVHSATGGRLSGFKAYYLGRNKWLTLFKHYPFKRLWIWLILLIIVDILFMFGSILRMHNLAPLRGRIAAWRSRRQFSSAGDRSRVIRSLTPIITLIKRL